MCFITHCQTVENSFKEFNIYLAKMDKQFMPRRPNYFYTDAETSVVKNEHLEQIETVPAITPVQILQLSSFMSFVKFL